MQRLILLRHGKAESTSGAGGDFERGLTERGRRESAMIGQALSKAGLVPDVVLVSTAKRALETWAAAEAAFPKARMARARELYNASPETLEEAIHAAGASAARLMIIGHNPGLHELAMELAADQPCALGAQLSAGFPTAGAAVFEAGPDGYLRLEHFLTPREQDLGGS